MSQFRVSFDGVDCLVSLADIPDGVSWRARIMRSGYVTREVTGFSPGMQSSCAAVQSHVEQEVREAVAWFEGRTARP